LNLPKAMFSIMLLKCLKKQGYFGPEIAQVSSLSINWWSNFGITIFIPNFLIWCLRMGFIITWLNINNFLFLSFSSPGLRVRHSGIIDCHSKEELYALLCTIRLKKLILLWIWRRKYWIRKRKMSTCQRRDSNWGVEHVRWPLGYHASPVDNFNQYFKSQVVNLMQIRLPNARNPDSSEYRTRPGLDFEPVSWQVLIQNPNTEWLETRTR
jgi:hypothetical protein